MGEFNIISDGTKEGTKFLIDGKEVITGHWKRLTWEYDLVTGAWTIKVEFLPPAEWCGLVPIGDVVSDHVLLDVCVTNGLGSKGAKARK